jgi:L-iditol 2-dehydrogenase
MKALIVEKPGHAVIREVPAPSAGEMDVLIRVQYSGICGTDLAIYSGHSSFIESGLIRYPIRIGHEWSGIVEATGSRIIDIVPGERVVCDNSVSCGQCTACQAGRFDGCKNPRAVGTINCWDGSFAEFMLMPARHVYRLPEQTSLENAALFEPASIACAGLNQCRPEPGSVLAVIGTGAIGLSAVALARRRGAQTIILIGRTPEKLTLGKQMGATHVINSREQDPAAAVQQICGPDGPSSILETSGDLAGAHLSVRIAGKRAVIALISFYEQMINDLPIDDIVSKELHVVGVMGSFRALQDVLQLMQEKPVDLTPMITHRYDFADCLAAFRDSSQMTGRVKIMVQFPMT